METENSQNVFSISITHNSKIRELSDGNRVIICQTTFLSWVPPFLSYELWKLRIELWKLLNQTSSKYFFFFLGGDKRFELSCGHNSLLGVIGSSPFQGKWRVPIINMILKCRINVKFRFC